MHGIGIVRGAAVQGDDRQQALMLQEEGFAEVKVGFFIGEYVDHRAVDVGKLVRITVMADRAEVVRAIITQITGR